MPFLDRFWWLRLPLGVAFLRAAPLLALWYLNTIAPIDLGHGPFGVANAILAAETTLILLYAGLVYLWRALRARSRRARRLDALVGNRDAIPLARPIEETSAPPDRETLPWQVKYPTPDVFTSFFFRAIILVFLICGAGFLGPLLFRYAQSLVSLNGPLILFGTNSPITGPGLFPIAGLALIPLFLTLVPQFSPASVWDRESGGCASLVADEEGMRWRVRSGRGLSMTWSDIRLFEVMYPSAYIQANLSGITWRISILYSGEQTVWWRERISGDGERRSGRFVTLERLIETGTTLQPRTFDPLLLPWARPTDAQRRRRWRIAAFFVALIIPIIVMFASRGLVFTLFPIGFVGYFAILWILQKRKSSSQPAEIPRVETGSDDIDAANHAYEMRTSARWYERARVLGIVIGAGVSLAFAAWLLYGVIEFKGPTVRHIVDLLSLIAFTDLFGGLAAIFTIAQIRSRVTIVRANADGLIQDGPIYWTLIPWSGVVAIDRDEQVNPPSYRVEGDVGSSVTWPVQAPKSLAFMPSEGMSLVTPEQLAEIVVARSGVPVTRRVHGKRASRAGGVTR